jgi:hypothetical protein
MKKLPSMLARPMLKSDDHSGHASNDPFSYLIIFTPEPHG